MQKDTPTLSCAGALGPITYPAQSYGHKNTGAPASSPPSHHQRLLKPTRLENVQDTVALHPLENIIREQVNEFPHRRSLTHQGVSVFVWDNLQQRQSNNIPPPLAPWRRPLVFGYMVIHLLPRNARQVRATRINTLHDRKTHEVDIYTDASTAPPLACSEIAFPCGYKRGTSSKPGVIYWCAYNTPAILLGDC